MQVILLSDVKSLGKKGEIVKVNDSYARNFIIPHKLGVEANKANLNDLKLQNANAEKIEAGKVAAAQEIKSKIDNQTVTITIKTGKDGKLFGSVTSKEVADAIQKTFGVSVDKKKIVMDPIKATGDHTVTAKLHKDVNASVVVKVVEG